MARAARRQHAIHHVDAQRDVIRESARACRRPSSSAAGPPEGAKQPLAAISHVTSCDSPTARPPIAYPGKSRSTSASAFSRRSSRVRAALHDAEKHLPRGIAMLREIILASVAPNSSVRAAASARALFGGRRFDAFVEHHDDVCAQRDFDFQRFFRRQENASEPSRCERNVTPSSRDFAQFAETENLEAAGIGKNCSGPGHKSVQAAQYRGSARGRDADTNGRCWTEESERRASSRSCLRLRLYGRRRAHRHERRRFDDAVRRR